MLSAAGALPSAEWTAELPGLPRDASPAARPLALRLIPLVPVPVHRGPRVDGAPVAELPTEVLGLALAVPVVDACAGWMQVLLPCKRDGAVGWVHLDAGVAVMAHHVHLEIDTRAGTVALVERTWRRTWPAGVGKPSAPTPRGRTFVLGVETYPNSTLVDHALVLAAHLTVGRRDTALALHSWPGLADGQRPGDTFGSVVVPAAALAEIEQRAVAGTAVLIR